MNKRILEKRQRALEDKAAKGKADSGELEQLARQIASYKERAPRRLYVDDITTEKLNSVLADGNGKAAIISAEGGIFDMLSGIYSKNVNIDVMLKGYSGDSIRVDRVGRNSESIIINRATLRFETPQGNISADNIAFIRISHHWSYDELHITMTGGSVRTITLENAKIQVSDNGRISTYALCKLDYIELGRTLNQ